MHITDPVADMLTRIRNANNAKHETVDVPASNMKKSIAQVLLDEGYIKAFQVIDDGTQGTIRITLKYNAGKEKVISGLRRVSKPAAPGTGVIAGGPVRIIMEAAGIKDIRTKCLRTNTAVNVVAATFEGLKALRTPEEVARTRGKSVDEIVG